MTRTALLALLFALLVGAVAVDTARRPDRSLVASLGSNVRFLYCGGAAIAAGTDPYAPAPIRQCAHRLAPESDARERSAYPSRLPGYALAIFVPLSRLPYAVAKPLWLAILLAAIFASAGYLAAMARVRLPLVLLALSLSAAYLSLTDGLLSPFVLLALSAAAFYLERKRFWIAAIALAVTIVAPQIGLVACVSAAIWLPRMRLPLGLAVAALAAFGVSTLGITRSIAYVLHVVPGRAFAELVAVDQWSLSHVLHVLGLPDIVAMWLGVVSYIAMGAIGIVVARRAATALDSNGLILALPAAAVLLGGAYLHEQQLCVAFPAAFLLASRARRARGVAWLALGLLVFPWFSLSDERAALFLSALTIALFAVAGIAFIAARGLSPLSRYITTAGAVVGCVILVLAFRHLPGPEAAATAIRAPQTHAVASDWGTFLRANPELSVASWQKEAEKAPSWIALACLILVAGAQSGRTSRERHAERQARSGIAMSAERPRSHGASVLATLE